MAYQLSSCVSLAALRSYWKSFFVQKTCDIDALLSFLEKFFRHTPEPPSWEKLTFLAQGELLPPSQATFLLTHVRLLEEIASAMSQNKNPWDIFHIHANTLGLGKEEFLFILRQEGWGIHETDYSTFLRKLQRETSERLWPPYFTTGQQSFEESDTLFFTQCNDESWQGHDGEALLQNVEKKLSVKKIIFTRSLFSQALIQIAAPFWLKRQKPCVEPIVSSHYSFNKPCVQKKATRGLLPKPLQLLACPLMLNIYQFCWLLQDPDLFYQKVYLHLPAERFQQPFYGSSLARFIRENQGYNLKEDDLHRLKSLAHKTWPHLSVLTLETSLKSFFDCLPQQTMGHAQHNVSLECPFGPLKLQGSVDTLEYDEKGSMSLTVYGHYTPATEENEIWLKAILAEQATQNRLSRITYIQCGYHCQAYSIAEERATLRLKMENKMVEYLEKLHAFLECAVA